MPILSFIFLLPLLLVFTTLPSAVLGQGADAPNVATTTTVTGPSQATLGEQLRIDVEVRAVTGQARPQGNISLRVGNSEFFASELDGSGNVRLPQFADLPAGTHQITAHYLGAGEFEPSMSAPLTVTVSAPTPVTTTTEIEGPTEAEVFERITYRVRTTPSQAGTLNFNLLLLNGYTISLAQPGPDGWATFTGSYPPGRHLIQGVYLPQLSATRFFDNGWSVSDPIELVVTGGAEVPATRTVLTGPSRVVQGQSLLYRAQVSERAGGAPAQGGRVHFLLNGNFYEAVDIDAQGMAELNIPYLPLGRYQIVARYLASATHGVSGTDDAPIWLEVGFGQNLSASSTALSITPLEIETGQTVTMTATVTGADSAVPQGNVSFRRGGFEIGLVPLNAQGVAVFRTDELQPFTARMTAHYLGSTRHGASSSRQVNVGITRPSLDTTTTLSGPTSRPVGEAIRFTARVAGSDGSTPTGRVFFRVDGDIVADVTLLSGVAQYTTSRLPEGRYRITAQFQGTLPAYRPSESEPLDVVIGDPPPDGDAFFGGGVLFAQTEACHPVLGTAPQAVTVRYSPGELGALPSGVTIAWRSGSEHLALWGPMEPSTAFLGGAGRATWSRFLFYPQRPLIRVVARNMLPEGSDLTRALEVMLRLRVQRFASVDGCAVTLAATLNRG